MLACNIFVVTHHEAAILNLDSRDTSIFLWSLRQCVTGLAWLYAGPLWIQLYCCYSIHASQRASTFTATPQSLFQGIGLTYNGHNPPPISS